MDTSQALQYLRLRFPDFADVIEKPERSEPPEPYYSYEWFSEEVLRRKDDTSLLLRVYSLIDEMSESGDSLLQDILAVSLLEALAQDATLAFEIRSHVAIGPRGIMKAIETSMYGRTID